MAYDNGHGIKITIYNTVINVEIYKNAELYLPFLNLRNIGASLNDEEDSNIYSAPRSRLASLIFIAQGVPKVRHIEDTQKLHIISVDELLIIAYTLPAFIVKEILDYIRMLRYKMINTGSYIFIAEEPRSLFGSVVAEYIDHRDTLNTGEALIVEGTIDPVVWNGGKFILGQTNLL